MAKRCLCCMETISGDHCPHCGYPLRYRYDGHQLPVGTLLRDRYQLGRVLGQGGFGITYLAWDTLMQQKVAVKEFYPSSIVIRNSVVSRNVQCVSGKMMPHFSYSRERFLREAEALVAFRHVPQIVDILDFFRENETAYIVMEYVRGMDLQKYVQKRGGRLSVEETFRILKPVMEALATVHRSGIVHRDISPDNIMLDPQGSAKLLDFGAVRKVVDPQVDKALDSSTEAVIKRGFAPVEQYNGRGDLGPWTDAYAMCATVWFCLTGEVPVESVERLTEGTEPDWSSIPGLSARQRQVLKKGFSVKAKDRYPDMDELLRALSFEEKEKRPRRKSLVPLAVAAVTVVLAVLAVLALCAPRSPSPEERYKEAEALMQEERYGEAAELFEELGDYGDSARKAENCRKAEDYDRARELMDQGSYGDAAALFEALGDYRDSREKAESCRMEAAYLHGHHLMDQESYTEAEQIFRDLGDYKDSAEMCEECRLLGIRLQARQLWEAGDAYSAATLLYSIAHFQDCREESMVIWAEITQREYVSAGYWHTVARRTDGTVAAVGNDPEGACEVDYWRDIVAVSAGVNHTVGLKADGTVVAVGYGKNGRCDVAYWRDIVAISAGDYHTVGLKADGTVVAVGGNEVGQCDVASWRDIVAISAGDNHTVGLKADGTVVAVGLDEDGRCDVASWRDIIAISAGWGHTVVLRSDGTVLAVGRSTSGQCDVASWGDIVAVSAGGNHTLGLRSDGTVVAVGWNGYGQRDVTAWSDIVAISAGDAHSIGLRADGTVVAGGWHNSGQCDVDGWNDILIPDRGDPFRG